MLFYDRMSLLLLLLLILLFINNLNAQTNIERKTKLCADPKCTEDLFPSFSIRDYISQDTLFLQHKQNSSLKVFAFKLSNRADFMEAETEDKKRGLIYTGHIDLEPYVIFLESALKTNKTLYMVDQENGKFIREVSAIPELARDYSAYAVKIEGYQLDKGLVAKLMALEQQQNVQKHSNHGHGHSHSHEEKNQEIKKAESTTDSIIIDEAGNNVKMEEILQKKNESKQPNVKIDEKIISSTEMKQNMPEENVGKNPLEEKAANEKENQIADDLLKKNTGSPITQNMELKMPTNDGKQNFEQIEEKSNSKVKTSIIPKQIQDDEKPNANIQSLEEISMPKNDLAKIENQKSSAEEVDEEALRKKISGQNSILSDPILKNVINQQPSEFIDQHLPIILEKQQGNNVKDINENQEKESEKVQTIIPEIIPSAISPVTASPSIQFETPESVKTNEQQIKNENTNEEQKLHEKLELEDNIGRNLNIVQAGNVLQDTKSTEEERTTAKEIESNRQNLDKEVANGKINYCFKEDCRGLDEIPSDKKPPTDSTILKMFRETMFSIRAFLPEPLCHFEDTGLIVLAAVLILAFIHFTSMLLSKSAGPEPFDHRLLHDCITRLKEQELVIEQQRTKVAENQHLAGAARAADQLQRENKILTEKLRAADGRNREVETENEQLKQSLKGIKNELDQSRIKVGDLMKAMDGNDAKLKQIEIVRIQIESELDENIAKLTKSQDRMKYLEAELEETQIQNGKLTAKLNNTQREAEKLKNECEEKKAEIDELLGIIAELNAAATAGSRRGSKRGSSAEIEEIPEEKKTKKIGGKEKKNVDNDTSSSPDSSPGQLLDDADNGVGSGGSAGWSDLGDGIGAEVETSEKDSPTKSKGARGQQQKPRRKFSPQELEKRIVEEEELQQEEASNTKLTDILEMAKLKSKLRSLETEREQLKFSLKVEKEEKENTQKEMERLRQELVEKDRESEKRELDRHGLTQQCTKLLQMIEEKERKMENNDQERERLRSRLFDVEAELRKMEDDKREMQHRLKDVEQSLKRSEELNGRLENKLYHEERRFNNKIHQLEEHLSLAKSSLSPMNLSGGGLSSDLNMSGNSSDREFIPFNGPEGGGGNVNAGAIGAGGGGGIREGGRSGVPSLWSEIDATEPIEELAALERQGGSMRRRRSIRTYGETSNRNSPYLSDLVHVSSSGREERLMNASKYSAASSATATAGAAPRQRMRSRSVGRQSARLTGVSASTAIPSLYGTISSSASLYNTSAAVAHHRDRASVVPMLTRNRRSRNIEDMT